MNSKVTRHYIDAFDRLPGHIKQNVRSKYTQFKTEPFHESLQFKQTVLGIWSVRINMQYRVLGRRNGNTIVWFWIGTHGEYDNLLKRLRG